MRKLASLIALGLALFSATAAAQVTPRIGDSGGYSSPVRYKIRFLGSGATSFACTDNSGGQSTDCTASSSGGGGGTVTSIATTGPLSGGTITSTGTLSCPTCALTTTTLTAGTGLTGGGDLSTNRTFAIDSTVATLTGTQTLTNKSISGASNTLTNIGNGALTNSSITFTTASPLGGAATVSLGGTLALTCSTCVTQAYATVQDEGTPLTQRSTMNFVGTGVTCADTSSITTCTIPGGGGSTGNYTFSTNTMDLSGAATMAIGPTTASAITLGGSAIPTTIAGNLTLTQGKTLTMGIDAVGTAQTVHTLIQNTTAATVGAQQYSPLLRLAGLGWGTTGGTSQAVNAALQLRPVQSTVPTGDLDIGWSIAGGAYAVKQSFLSSGGITAATIGPVDTQQHTLPAVASDTIALLAAAQTFMTKTLTAPVLGGSVTGTYTLAGTPTITAPTINAATLTGTLTSTANYSKSTAAANGTTVPTTASVLLSSTTAATAGATAQMGHTAEFGGTGWKTTATAASQVVLSGFAEMGTSNTTSPDNNLLWYTSVNASTRTPRLRLSYSTVSGNAGIYFSSATGTGTAGVTFKTAALDLGDGSGNTLEWNGNSFFPTNGTGTLGQPNDAFGGSWVANFTYANGTKPTCAVGVGAGSGATCSLSANSTDAMGTIVVTTGTGTTANAVFVTMTYNHTYNAGNSESSACLTQPVSSATRALTAAGSEPTPESASDAAGTMVMNTAPVAPTASTALTFRYFCSGVTNSY